MNFLDRLAFNRLVAIVLNFIIALIKIINPKVGKELEDKHPLPPIPKPPLKKRRILPRKQEDSNE